MTFEETVIFYNPVHAGEFAKTLAAEGCRTKTKVVKALVKETMCKASIKNFKAFFAKELDEIKDDDTDIAGVLKGTYEEIISELSSMETEISAFLSTRTDGCCITDDADVKKFDETVKKEGGIAAVSELAANGDEFLARMMRVLPVLEENGKLKVKEDGKKYLAVPESVEDLITAMPSEVLLEGTSPETRKEYNIKTVVNVMSGLEYHITTPSEFAFKVDLKELDELMKNFSYDTESYTRMKEDIFLKTLLAERIQSIVKEKSKAGADEIVEEIKDVRIAIPETGDEFAFDLERDYIAGIIQDMKSIGILKGKGNRYRV